MPRWLPGRIRPNDPFQRFTDRARAVVVLAEDQARMLNHNHVGTEHLLLGFISEHEGVAAKALTSLGISPEAVGRQVNKLIGHGARTPSGGIPLTPLAKKTLVQYSRREARRLGHNYIGTEHLLLGLLGEREAVAVQVLGRLGASHARVREQVLRVLTGETGSGQPVHQTPELREYEEKIAEVRTAKQAAINAREFGTAAALRDAEKQLLAEQAQREQQLMAGIDLVAMAEENQRLHREVERLRALLRRHGIEPDDGTSKTA